MNLSRRRFLQSTSALGAGFCSLALRRSFAQHNDPGPRAAPSQPLLHSLALEPFVDALSLPVRAEVLEQNSHRLIQIRMREIYAKVHRDVPPTRMWSYGETALAPLIDVQAHRSLQVEWMNDLPTEHFLPIDYSLHGCGRELPQGRAVVHVHGARTRAQDDGFPTDWFRPGKRARNTYPLAQDATALWYHDHTMGLNRLNLYAGLFGMFLLRDEEERRLQLPRDHFELPLILYDRNFTQDGQLFYPVSGDPEHPWVPEFAADAILINGKIRPFHQVEPRIYRLRLLNAANSRFFRLSFAAGTTSGVGRSASPEPFVQIGSDQGLLRHPVSLTALTLAPAERADVLIDLSGYAGQKLYLLNGALPVLEWQVAGTSVVTSRNRRDVTRVGVSAASPAVQPSISSDFLPSRLLRNVQRQSEALAVRTRTLTLSEVRDPAGNTLTMVLNGKHWHEPVTEQVRLNTSEIWEFVNLTEDTHPMHLHLVRFQILDRRPLDVFAYTMRGERQFAGPAIQPPENEAGWKDVVACDPGAITRVLIRFEGFTGRYLYHCHIMEHEANDMMRPYDVLPEKI